MCSDQEQRDLTERFMLQQELESMAVAYLNQDEEEEKEHEMRKAAGSEGRELNGSSDNGIQAKRDKDESCGKNDNKNQKRWKLLSCSLLQIPLNDKASDAFKFPSFGLFEVSSVPSDDKDTRNWCTIRVNSVPGLLFKVCTVKPVFSHKELHGYNNTGNVQIWASEECTSMFCLENQEMFRGKTVVELGAGMTALAGLVVAAECNPAKIILTDGNEKSVENVAAILESNPFYCPPDKVTSRVVKWDQDDLGDLEGCADIVLCSDCLFFDEGRAPLVQCLKRLLRPGCPEAQVLLIQPRRRGTMKKFIDLIDQDGHFEWKLSEKITDEIETILQTKIITNQMYEADIHQSLLLTLQPKLQT